jgi:hypothetical protein
MSSAPVIVLSPLACGICMFVLFVALTYVALILFNDVIDERKWEREQARAHLQMTQQSQATINYRRQKATCSLAATSIYRYQQPRRAQRLQQFRAAPVATV